MSLSLRGAAGAVAISLLDRGSWLNGAGVGSGEGDRVVAALLAMTGGGRSSR
jgi:hypothetical protein